MQEATGIVSVVQEGRFRLDTEDGRSLHFTLSRHAAVEPQDLPRFRGHHVAVAYGGKTGMEGRAAHDIRRVPA